MSVPPPGQAITEGPEPKHTQLSAVLARMASEELGPGAMIPSERSLMAAYGVSRATVRRAVEALIVDGLLQRVHGKGTFVTEPRMESRLHLASFSQDMRRRGLEPSTVLLRCEESRPPSEAVRALGLGERDTVWELSRIRLADGQPIALETGWYPARLLPGLNRKDLSGSLYEILALEYSMSIDSAEQTLWGETADRIAAAHLDAGPTTPLLVFRRVSRAAGRPVEYVVSRYRGDRYQIHMELGAEGTGLSEELQRTT